jgi:3-hydroxymyristoyl/3-hydroxydecanoyl-(acyl carrier protein) dehydratase
MPVIPMLAEGDNLLKLIPQRPPMVMVGALLSCDDKKTVCNLQLEESNIFIEKGIFTTPGIMELMAQTAATRTGWLASSSNDGGDFKPPIGVIGSISKFKLYRQPLTGETLKSEVEVQNEIFNATLAACRVFSGEKLIAEAELKIFITGD